MVIIIIKITILLSNEEIEYLPVHYILETKQLNLKVVEHLRKKMQSKWRPTLGPIFTITLTDENILIVFNSEIDTLTFNTSGKEFHVITQLRWT